MVAFLRQEVNASGDYRRDKQKSQGSVEGVAHYFDIIFCAAVEKAMIGGQVGRNFFKNKNSVVLFLPGLPYLRIHNHGKKQL